MNSNIIKESSEEPLRNHLKESFQEIISKHPEDLYKNSLGYLKKKEWDSYAIRMIMAANQNYQPALDHLNETDYINNQDYSKTKKFYELTQEYSYSLCRLGYMYHSGYGVNVDLNKALIFYEKAIDQNNSNAMNNLASMYIEGLGIPKDYDKARELCERAVQNKYFFSFNILGVIYHEGLGLHQDFQKAKELYEIAAEKGDPFGFFNLGRLYREGSGVPQDYEKAKKFYEIAIEKENPNAMVALGLMYLQGTGVSQDYMKSKELFEMGAEKNDACSIHHLALLYQEGLGGVLRDLNKAKELYIRAIACGSINAAHNLGNIYKQENNYIQAREFYELSFSKWNFQKENLKSLDALIDLYKSCGLKEDKKYAVNYFISIDKSSCLKDIYGYDDLDIEMLREYHSLKKENLLLRSHIDASPDGALFFEAFQEWTQHIS